MRRTLIMMAMRGLLLPALGVVAVAAAIRECSNQEPAFRRDGPGPLAVYGDGWTEDDAEVAGILRREGRCLYLEMREPEGGRGLIAFGGRGLGWDEDLQTVRTRHHRHRVGEYLRTNGGYSSDPIGMNDWLVPPAPECDTSTVIFAGDS